MRASVAENKCDDLAAMCQLLLSPGPVQDRVEAGAAGCGAALPSLSPTEVYTEAGDPGPGLYPSTRAAQGGRPSHPLPGLQSPPPQFTLPQINLPQNLPLVSNKPFTDFSDLRAHGPPCLRLRRVLLAGAREEGVCGRGGDGRPLLSRPGHEEHNQPLLDAPVLVPQKVPSEGS